MYIHEAIAATTPDKPWITRNAWISNRDGRGMDVVIRLMPTEDLFPITVTARSRYGSNSWYPLKQDLMAKLTVAGAVSASNTFKAFVGAPAAVAKGDVPGKGWTTIVSGTTSIAAPTGSGVTVVELNENGCVISIGYCASVTAKT